MRGANSDLNVTFVVRFSILQCYIYILLLAHFIELVDSQRKDRRKECPCLEC